MGSMARHSRAGRFIEMFGERIKQQAPIQEGDWIEVVSVSAGFSDSEEVVRTYATVRNKRTGDELVVTLDDCLFDPESFMDDGSNVDAITYATYNGDTGDDEKLEAHRKQVITDLKKAELIHPNYQEETT